MYLTFFSFLLVFVAVGTCISCGIGGYPNWIFFCGFIGMFMFFCAHWQTYVSGTLRFGLYVLNWLNRCCFAIIEWGQNSDLTFIDTSTQGWCHRSADCHYDHVPDVSLWRRELMANHGNQLCVLLYSNRTHKFTLSFQHTLYFTLNSPNLAVSRTFSH